MSIGKVSITKEESVPFLNPDGTLMQMVQFRVGVTVEADTKEEAEKEADELFQCEREKLSLIVPMLQTKERRIKFVLDKLKQFATLQYESVVNQAKLIK